MKIPRHIIVSLNSIIVLIIFTIAVVSGIVYFLPKYTGSPNAPELDIKARYPKQANTGSEWAVNISVENQGEKTVNNLFAEIRENDYVETAEAGELELPPENKTTLLLNSKVFNSAEKGEANITVLVKSKRLEGKKTVLPITIP